MTRAEHIQESLDDLVEMEEGLREQILKLRWWAAFRRWRMVGTLQHIEATHMRLTRDLENEKNRERMR